MIIEKKQRWKTELKKLGGSWYLLIDNDMFSWMEIDKSDGEKEGIEITIQADEGKHGRFLGFGKSNR